MFKILLQEAIYLLICRDIQTSQNSYLYRGQGRPEGARGHTPFTLHIEIKVFWVHPNILVDFLAAWV